MEESKYMEEKSMTIKELKEFIKDLPDETKVIVGDSDNSNLTTVTFTRMYEGNKDTSMLVIE